MSTRLYFLGAVLLAVLFAVGCSSGPTQPKVTTMQFTSPSAAPVIDQGQSFSVTVEVPDGSPVTWSLLRAYGTPQATPIGTLSNQSNAGATYTACSPGTGCLPNQQLTIVASAGNNSTTLAVVVNALPTINLPSSLLVACPPTGQPPAKAVGIETVGVFTTFPSTSSSLSVTGGVAPYTWTVVSGSLPAGLSLGLTSNASTSLAVITGTPSAAGCPASGATLQITDATGATGTAVPIFLAVVPPPLSVKAPNYSNGVAGVSYTPTAFQVVGGAPPYTWCVSTASSSGLPVGLTAQTLPPTSSWTSNGSGFNCSPAQASPTLVVYGTTDAANELQSFSPNLQVFDSQSPYPAVGSPGITMNVLAATTCDPAAATDHPYFQPGVPHAFQLKGFDSHGPVVIEGSFTTQNVLNADGTYQGIINAGSEDIIRSTGSQANLSLTGTYSSAANHGCLSLTNSAGTTSKFQFTLSGCSYGASTGDCTTVTQPSDPNTICSQQNIDGTLTYFLCLPVGRIIEFDDTDGTGTEATGILRTQDSTTFSGGLSGLYAFGMSGWDSSSKRYATAGSFSASSGSLSAVAADINDAGAVQSALNGGSGSLGAVDANTGRATVSLTVGTASLSLVGYVINSHEIMLSTTGTPGAGTPTISGEAIGTSGPFSFSSLQNAHIFRMSGSSSAGPDVSIGLLNFDGLGSVTGTIYQDQAGTLGTTAATAVYSVDSNTGRTNLSAPVTGQTLGAHPFTAYIVPPSSTLTRSDCVNPTNCITGFIVGTTDSTAQAGVLEFQTPLIAPPPPFFNDYVAGYYAYGSDELLAPSTTVLEGFSRAQPSTTNSTSGSLFVNQDSSNGDPNYCVFAGLAQACNLLINNDQLNPGSSYTVNTNGTGTVDGQSISVTNGNVIFYIHESPLDTSPSIIVAEQ